MSKVAQNRAPAAVAKPKNKGGRPVVHKDEFGNRNEGHRLYMSKEVLDFLESEKVANGRSYSETVNMYFKDLIKRKNVLGGKSEVGGVAMYILQLVERGKLEGAVTWEDLGAVLKKFDRVVDKRAKEGLEPPTAS
jgi:hypothetical protein